MAARIANDVTENAVRSAVRAVREELSGREDYGWRVGKPTEDPEKIKRWGIVTAKPSEYLVHMRRGRILPKSGQGASCFKWPWDSVAIIPTTLQRLYFQADQVTSEKVGVQVKGLAVYRIARPELAVRMLNFSFPERAQEKLGETLREMFVGAARRLVANLSVEACLTRRKEALASFLMAEIAPVVTGAGKASDTTDRGWGVLLDTIEIQEVRVLSEAVFAHMQAPFRNQLMLRAREAELARERETAETQARSAAQLRELKAVAESQAALVEAGEERKRLAAWTESQRARVEAELDAERRALEKQAALDQARAERDRELARVGLAREAEEAAQRAQAGREGALAEDALAAERSARARERAKAEAQADAEIRQLKMELARREGELKAAQAAREREVENTISAAKLQSDFVNHSLPEIARVLQQQFGKVEIVAGAGDNPFGFLVHAFESVMEVARKSGLQGAAGQLAASLAPPPAPRPAPASSTAKGPAGPCAAPPPKPPRG